MHLGGTIEMVGGKQLHIIEITKAATTIGGHVLLKLIVCLLSQIIAIDQEKDTFRATEA